MNWSVAKLLISASAATLSAAPALAKEERNVDRAAIGLEVVQVCMTSPMGEGLEAPEVGCSCMAGVLSARMTDDQFYILGRVAPYAFTGENLDRLEAELVAQGYTDSEFNEVAAIIDSAVSVADETCWPMRR